MIVSTFWVLRVSYFSTFFCYNFYILRFWTQYSVISPLTKHKNVFRYMSWRLWSSFFLMFLWTHRDTSRLPFWNNAQQQWSWWRWRHLLGVSVSRRSLESPAKANTWRESGDSFLFWRWCRYDAFLLCSPSNDQFESIFAEYKCIIHLVIYLT